MLRVRRKPIADVVESIPSRVRRSRPVTQPQETPDKPRLTRVRKAVEAPEVPRVGRRPRIASAVGKESSPRPLFVIDWERSLGWKLQIYLVTSYLYYERSKSLITDHDYDRLCKELAAGWRTLTHQHKHLVDIGQLVAGTGYAVKDYPLMVMGAASHMLKTFGER